LRKSQVKEHLRHTKTGKTVVVHEHEDSRKAKELSKDAERSSKTAKERGDILSHKLASDAHTRAATAHRDARNAQIGTDAAAEHFVGIHHHQLQAKKHQQAGAAIHAEENKDRTVRKSLIEKTDAAKDEEDEGVEKSAIIDNLKDGVKQVKKTTAEKDSNGTLVKSVVHAHIRRTKNGSVPVREHQDGRSQRLAVNRNHALTHIGQLWRSGTDEAAIVRSLSRTYGLKPQEAIDLVAEFKKGRGVAKSVIAVRLPSGKTMLRKACSSCFICKIDGGKRCDGSCGLCADCPGK
jgi:hypothetical protein